MSVTARRRVSQSQCSKALNFCLRTRKVEFSQAWFIDHLFARYSISSDSYRGHVAGFGRGKLWNHPTFKKDWCLVKRGRQNWYVKHECVLPTDQLLNGLNYDTPEKQAAREFIYEDLPFNKARIFTLPAAELFDVKYAMSRCLDLEAHACEYEPHVADQIRKSGLVTTCYYGDLARCLATPEHRAMYFANSNLDAMLEPGLVAERIYRQANENANASHVYLTIVLGNARNGLKKVNTPWAVNALIKYGDSEDLVLRWTADIFTNYELVNCHEYYRDENKHSSKMLVIKLRIKDAVLRRKSKNR